MNVHTPERHPNESRDAYKARRLQSRDINYMNGRDPHWIRTPRQPGSMATSAILEALLMGHKFPEIKKRKSRKVRA